MAEEAAVELPEQYPPFSEVTSDPRWEGLKPNEKLGIVDRWTHGLRQFSAAHPDWDQNEVKKTIDQNYTDLRFKVLDNHQSVLNELTTSLAGTMLSTAEAPLRYLNSSGGKEELLKSLDNQIASYSKELGVNEKGDVTIENPNYAQVVQGDQLTQLKKQRDSLASGDDTVFNTVQTVRNTLRGWADWLQARREALPTDPEHGINPAKHDTMMAGASRGVGKLLAMINPLGPAVVAGETYTQSADDAITKAKAAGETDPDKLAALGHKAGIEGIESSLPQLAAYSLGGPIAKTVVSKVAATAEPLVQGLVGGASSALANLTVSGTSRAIDAGRAAKEIDANPELTPEQKAKAKAELPGFFGDTEQNLVDIGFGAYAGLHTAQDAAHFNVLKAHVQETLGKVDSHPTFTPQQKQAAKDAILNRIEDPAKRSVVSAEYEAAKAKAPVDAATVPLGPDSPTAQVSQRIAEENQAAAVLAALQRDHETAKAEIATAEAKAAEEAAKSEAETPAAEPEPAPVESEPVAEPAPVEPKGEAPEPDIETQLKALGLTDDLIETLSPAEAEQIIADSKTKAVEEAKPEPAIEPEPEPVVVPEPQPEPAAPEPAPETLPEVNESVDTKEPEPVPAAASIDPERKAVVDEFFGNKENYDDLTDLAARYISKRRILGADPTDLVTALYQKALTKGKLDIKKGAWRVWDDEFGRKQERDQARRGASLDTETEAGTLGDVIGETTPAEIAANARAEEAPKPVDLDAYRESLTPEDRDTFDRLSVKAQNGEHYRTKKEKAFMAKMERELRGPKAPVDESIPEPEPVEDAPASNDDRRHAIDRAYKLHTRDVLSGAEYKAFKERIEDAENLSELHAIHRELEARTPVENLSWTLLEDKEHHERTERETVAQRRDYYRLGGTLNQALTRLMEVTTDKGLRALATVLRFATHADSRIRVSASLREDKVSGRYDPLDKLTEINPFIPNKSIEETIAHEALHDATLNKIHDYLHNDGARLTPTEREAIRQLEALRQEALGHAPKEVREASQRVGESEGERLRAAVRQNAEAAPFYGLMSLREYVSEMLTNRQFQEFLNSHKVLTTAPRGQRLTYWDRTMQLLARLFGAKPGTILAESIRHSAGLFKERPLNMEGDRVIRNPESPLRAEESPHKDLLDRATELRDMQARLRTLRKEAPGSARDLHEIVREHLDKPGNKSLAEKLTDEGGLPKEHAEGVARIVDTPVVDPVEKSAQALGIVPGYLDVNEALVKMWDNSKNYFSTFKPGTWWKAWYNAADNKAGIFARQQRNDVAGTLREVMGRTAKTPERLNKLDQRALSFIVEAQSDPAKLATFRTQIKNAVTSGASKSLAWRRATAKALNAIDHAEANFTRLEKAADVYRRITNNQVTLENRNGVATPFRKGYVPHIQDIETGFEMPFDRSGGTTGTSFKKLRTHDTFADSISAGVKPKTLDALDALENRVRRGNQVINRQKWAEAGHSLIDPKSKLPLVDKVTTTKHPATGTTSYSVPHGYEMRTLGNQVIAVHRGYTGIFDAMTAPSAITKSVPGRGLMWTAGTVKHGLLLFDTFHLGRLAYYQLPLRGLGAFAHKQGLLALDYTPAELQNMERRGQLPSGIKAAAIIARKKNLATLVNAGYNVGGVQDAMYAGFMRQIPVVGGFNKFVFEQFQRGGMALTGLLEFDRQRAAYPKLSEGDVARKVARDLNARFGNMRKEGVFANNTLRDLAQLVFLAPSWNEGLLRSELGTVRQAGALVKDLAMERQLRVGTLLKGSGTLMLGTFVMNQLINLYTRNQFTWDNEEEGINAKISAWIPDKVGDGPGFFLNPLALPAELTHQTMSVMERGKTPLSAVAEVVGYKFAPSLRVAHTFITRTDRFNRPITSDWDVMKEMVLDLAPIPITGQSLGAAVQSLGKGQVTEPYKGAIEKQAFASMGVKLDGAPSDGTRIRRLADDFNKEKGIVKDPRYSTSDYTELTQAIANHDRERAQQAYAKLALTKTEDQIQEHYLKQVEHPFTGSEASEEEFIDKLTEKQKATYERAIKERERLRDQFLELELTAPQPTG